MGVQIIQDHHDPFSFPVFRNDQPFHKPGKVSSRSGICNLDMMLTGLRLNCHKDIAGSMTPVLIVVFHQTSGLHGYRRS